VLTIFSQKIITWEVIFSVGSFAFAHIKENVPVHILKAQPPSLSPWQVQVATGLPALAAGFYCLIFAWYFGSRTQNETNKQSTGCRREALAQLEVLNMRA